MRAIEFLTESKVSLQDLYKGDYPDRNEIFWDYVTNNELKIPLEVETLTPHKLKIILLSQYRIEHLDELYDMMDDDQKELIKKYVDSDLSDKVIVIADDRIIDGNHRALAASIKNSPIKYIDLSDLDNESIDEMALSKYTTFGDFTKPGPFRGPDKRLIPHPTNKLKTQKFFEQTPYDFRLFFSNIPGTGRYSEYGPMSPEEIRKVFPEEAAQQIIDGHDDAITVVYVGNKGDAKVMLTPWIMAHRFGHAVQAGVRSQKGWSEWREAEEHFFNKVHDLLKQYYGKMPRKDDTFRIKMSLASEYNALFNALGTQKSSRKGIIRRPYEFMYELLAQYIGTGKITLNPFPDEQGYGRKVFGRYVQYLKIKPEYRDTDDRIHASEILANDMEINFNNVLASSVGKIYVM